LLRVFAAVMAAMLLLTVTAPSADAEFGDGIVYLERDGSGRYRPTVDDGKGRFYLVNRDSITAPAVSPDKTQVAFSGVLGNGSLGQYAIFVLDADGGSPRQLTNGNLGEYDPVWVSGGQWIVYSQNLNGSITGSNCCRLAKVNVNTGQITILTSLNGAQRPTARPNGTHVYFDRPSGIWRIPVNGGSSNQIASNGYDPAISENGQELVFLRNSGGNTQLRRVGSGGGNSVVLYSTPNEIENPVWMGNRIYFVEHLGLGYDGRKSVTLKSISRTGGSPRIERRFSRTVVGVTPGINGDELFVYRNNGTYRFFDVRPDGSTAATINSGDDYTSGWSAITSVNLDGDGQDEMFFYRNDGLYRYYNIRSDGSVGSPIRAGTDYTSGWDAITAVDLGGDGQDEMFFYRDDGLYRYYDIASDGRIGAPIRAGSDYTKGWDAITAVNIDADSGDEMFFYRSDGLYRFYEIDPNGRIGSPIIAGDDYTTGWDAIVAIDLDGDGRDEMFFYRDDGLYRYYNVRSDGRLGTPIRQGSNFSTGWTSVTAVNLPIR
jgi:Tol biopolymer transport system component